MNDKEIKVNLTELEHMINLMDGLKKQAQEIVVVRKIYEDYLMKNTGKAKEKMKACEYKSAAIKNNLALLIEKTSIFLRNTKLLIEGDEKYISRKIDTLTK